MKVLYKVTGLALLVYSTASIFSKESQFPSCIDKADEAFVYQCIWHTGALEGE